MRFLSSCFFGLSTLPALPSTLFNLADCIFPQSVSLFSYSAALFYCCSPVNICRRQPTLIQHCKPLKWVTNFSLKGGILLLYSPCISCSFPPALRVSPSLPLSLSLMEKPFGPTTEDESKCIQWSCSAASLDASQTLQTVASWELGLKSRNTVNPIDGSLWVHASSARSSYTLKPIPTALFSLSPQPWG